jgi:hypothetical protein
MGLTKTRIKNFYIALSCVDTISLAIILALTIINGIYRPITLGTAGVLTSVHIINYIVNMYTKYKYTVIPILVKLFFGHIYFLWIDFDHPICNIPLINFNTMFFIASFILQMIHGIMQCCLSAKSPNVYQAFPTSNQPILNNAQYITNTQQGVPGNQQQGIYFKPQEQQQQQVYYYYPQQNTNGNAIVQAPSGQVTPQYYPQQTQNISGVNAAVYENNNMPLPPPSDNMVTNGETNNQ